MINIFGPIHQFLKKILQGTARSAVLYGIASFLTQGLMIIYLIIIARWLGAENYGYIAAAYAAATLSAFIFNWGFNEWMMKTGANSTCPEAMGANVITIKFLLGLVWGISLWLILRHIRPELYLDNVLLLTIMDTWFDSSFGTFLVVLILKSRITSASVLLVFSRVFRLLTALGLIWLMTPNIHLVITIRFLSTLTIFIFTWILVKPIFLKQTLSTFLLIFRQSSAFNYSELLNLIFLYADVNILSLLGTGTALIANYSIAVNLVIAITTLPLGIANVLIPSMTRLYEKAKNEYLLKIAQLTFAFVGLGILLWAGTTMFGQPTLLTFMGKNYFSSATLIKSLAPLLLFRTLSQVCIIYLISIGQQKNRLLPQGIATFAKIMAGIFVVIFLHETDIIWVVICAEAFLFLSYLFQALKHYIPAFKGLKT